MQLAKANATPLINKSTISREIWANITMADVEMKDATKAAAEEPAKKEETKKEEPDDCFYGKWDESVPLQLLICNEWFDYRGEKGTCDPGEGRQGEGLQD